MAGELDVDIGAEAIAVGPPGDEREHVNVGVIFVEQAVAVVVEHLVAVADLRADGVHVRAGVVAVVAAIVGVD
ncbi:MAG: hypothetical protein ACI9K2_007268 [Myxococcota bacterium]